MSWQAYTDNLIASGKVDKAALYSRAGDSIWANSNGYILEASEISGIAQGFDDPSALQASGLHACGVKYFLLKNDERSLYGRHENEGIVCVRTQQAILIAHYPPTSVAGDVAKIVEKLADYLISVGY